MMRQFDDVKLLQKNTDLGIFILRITVGGLMLFHGISKLMHGIGFIEQLVVDSGLPSFVAYGVYVGELLASILIILGIATRVSALIFAFNMVVAILMAHIPDIFTVNDVGGWTIELQVFFILGALALALTGGGKYALSNKYIWD